MYRRFTKLVHWAVTNNKLSNGVSRVAYVRPSENSQSEIIKYRVCIADEGISVMLKSTEESHTVVLFADTHKIVMLNGDEEEFVRLADLLMINAEA